MESIKYIKIYYLFFCIVGFCSIVRAQNPFDEMDKIIRLSIIDLNRQYQGKLSGSQTVYVLDTEWGKAVFPDKNTCEGGKRTIENKLDQFQKRVGGSWGTESQSSKNPNRNKSKAITSLGQHIMGTCHCKSQNNPSYNPNSSSNINKETNAIADLRAFDNFDIPIESNTTQIQGSIFAATGARERKQEPPANNEPPKMDLSNLEAYVNEQPKEKTISDVDIKDIVESCIKASDFCACVQTNFTKLTGKNLQGKNAQIKNDEIIADNRLFNEYLGKISRGLDARAKEQKGIIDDRLKDIENNFRAELEKNHQSAEMLDMAKMADYVYRDGGKLPAGWNESNNNPAQKLLEEFNNIGFVNDGFYAEIYEKKCKNGITEYVLAFRGSENPLKDPRDWITNASQAMGSDIFRTQYKKANDLITALNTCKNCSVSITGHSLGGGLASAAGLNAQVPTYTFNAAGVHENTIKDVVLAKKVNEKKYIKAYYSNKDPLNYAQDNPATTATVAGAASLAQQVVPGASALSAAGQYIGVASGTPEGLVAADVLNKVSNPVSAVSTAATLPPALGERIPLGDIGNLLTGSGHGIQELINTVEAPLIKEKSPLEKEKSQISISTEALKVTLSSCFAAE